MATAKTKQYYEGVGRRKTSVAQVRLIPGGKGKGTVNGKDILEFIPEKSRRDFLLTPVVKTGVSVDFTIKVSGGGLSGQMEAIRLGISRAIVEMDAAYRPTLKAEGFLKRDSRKKERMKPGLKKARRAKQWRKR